MSHHLWFVSCVYTCICRSQIQGFSALSSVRNIQARSRKQRRACRRVLRSVTKLSAIREYTGCCAPCLHDTTSQRLSRARSGPFTCTIFGGYPPQQYRQYRKYLATSATSHHDIRSYHDTGISRQMAQNCAMNFQFLTQHREGHTMAQRARIDI